MANEFIRKLLTVVSSLSILIQSLSPFVAIVPIISPASAYAADATSTATQTAPTDTPTPTVDQTIPTTTPTVTPTPTIPTDTPTPTVTPSPTIDPNLTLTPTPTPIQSGPTDTLTPTATPTISPTDTPTATSAPTDTPTPTSGNTNNNPSQAPPASNAANATATVTPSTTPFVTPANNSSYAKGDLATSILKNVSAPSLDLSTTPTSSATLTTNKADYSPTDTAIITGTNFEPNNSYSLTISSTDSPATSSTVNVRTDKDGTFTYAYQLDGHYRPNYSVVVKDEDGTVLATTTFTDSPSFSSQTVVGACMTVDQHGKSLTANGNSCTANDTSLSVTSTPVIIGDGATFADASNSSNGKGCQYPGDYVKFTTNWQIQTNATQRFNFGLWFASAGQASVTGGGQCSITSLPSSPLPFSEQGSDTCGDLGSSGTGNISVTMVAICNPDNSGLLKIPYCTSWSQQDGACSDPTQTLPENGSKCSCNSGFTIPVTIPPAIEVIKSLSPSGDPGLFNLLINTVTKKTDVTNGGTTGKIGISTGSNTFGEQSGTSTSLSNYTSTASCVLRGTTTSVATTGSGPTWTIPNVTNGQDIVCTISNTRSTGTIELTKHWVGAPGSTTLNIGTSSGGSQTATQAVSGADGTTGTKTVNNGTYFLSETGGLTNYSSSLACTDNGSTATVTNSSVPVTAGHTVICTFTNTLQQAHLTLAKTVTNDNGGNATAGQWTLTATGNTNISGATGSNNVTNASVLPGTYALSETGGPSGYTQGTYSCVKNGQSAVVSNSITLANGDSATCTVNNNDNPPSLTLKKVVSNTHGGTATAGQWTLTATGASGSPTNLSGTTPVSSSPTFKADTYTLAESNGPSGYSQSTWTCTNGVTVNNNQITLALGQSTTCTITNSDEAPTLRLVKQVTNNNGGTNVPHDWTLTANGTGGFSDFGDSITFHPVTAGVAYTLSESTIAGYAASAWTCIGADIQNTNQVTLLLGQNVTCTITNDDVAPSLTLIKQVVGGSDPASSWTLTATGTGGSPTNLSGTTGVKSGGTFKADTYTLAESGGPSGYTASTYSCVKNNGAPVSANSITLAIGDTATCTITNTRDQGTIELKKVWSGTGGQTTLNIGTSAGGSQVISTQTGTNGSGPLTTNPQTVNTGTYFLSETGGLTNYASILSCTDNNQPATVTNSSVNVAKGHTVICTFTNTRNTGTIELKKTWVGTAGQTTLTIGSTNGATDVANVQTGSNGTAPLTTGAKTVNTGTYFVNETGGLTGYTTSLSCADNGTPVTPGTNNSLSVTTGHAVVCTFTNTRDQGTIELKKVWSGTGGQTTLNIGSTNGGTDVASQLTGANGAAPLTTNPKTVNTGTYFVAETGGLANYTPALNCTDNGNAIALGANNSVTVNKGDSVVCTFTNTRQTGTITVNKTLVPSFDQGTFNLQVDGITKATGGDGTTTNQITVDTGTHSVAETSANGTNFANYSSTYSCTDNSNPLTSGKGTSISGLNVNANDNVICTFTNIRNTGDLQVKKIVDDGSPLSDWAFSLDNANAISADPNTGIVDFGQVTTNVNHTITEGGANQSNYTLVSVTGTNCTNNNDGSSATANVPNASNGVVCVFTNDRNTGTIQVKKIVSPSDNGATSWNFAISGQGPSNTSNNNVLGLHDGDSSQVFTDYTGNYIVTESGTSLTNYTTTYSCTDGTTTITGSGSTTSLLTLNTGKNIVCTFTNTRKTGSITVNKLVDVDGSGTFTGDNTIANTLGFNWNLDGTGTNAMGTTVGSVTTGQHSINEASVAGYHFVGWYPTGNNIYSCTNPFSTNIPANIAVAYNFTTDITLCNAHDTGGITVHKALDATGSGTFITDDATANSLGFSWSLDKGSANQFGTSVNGVTTLDTHSVNENLNNQPYHFVGWYPTGSVDFSCTKPEGLILPANFSLSFNGDTREITLCNARDTGTLIVHKLQDTTGGGNYNTLDSKDFTWGTDPNITAYAMGGNGQTLTTGNYNIYESSVTGYKFTGWFYGDPRDNQFSCTNLPKGQQYLNLPTNQTVSSNDSTVITLCNQKQIPILTITKTNDKLGVDQHTGDSVLYTITITATQAAAANVVLTDLLPKGFNYRNGSATIDTGSGPSAFTNFTDAYHSPGIWNLGSMSLGQTDTLTLIADIDGGVNPGDYKDIAFANGTPVNDSLNVVYANADPNLTTDPGYISDPNFVGTHVNVVVDNQSSLTLQPTIKQVLGASTELPSTGANALWSEIAIALVIGGFGLLGYGIILQRKKYGKNN